MFGDKLNFGNLGSLMKNAKKIQEMVEQQQSALEKATVTGESGAGAVQVTMNGRGHVQDVTLDPALLTEDKAVMESLIAAAINDAAEKKDALTQDQMSDLTDLFGGAKQDSSDQ